MGRLQTFRTCLCGPSAIPAGPFAAFPSNQHRTCGRPIPKRSSANPATLSHSGLCISANQHPNALEGRRRHCQHNNSVEIPTVPGVPYQCFLDLFECLTLSCNLVCNLLCTPQSSSQGEAHPSLKFCEKTVESFLVKLLFSFPCSLATYLCSSAETPERIQTVAKTLKRKPGEHLLFPRIRNLSQACETSTSDCFAFNVFSPTSPTHRIVLVTEVTGDLFEL